MIKIRVHIKTSVCDPIYMDEDVFIDIKLPALPPINSNLYLSEEHQNKLMAMCLKNLDIANRYCDWFYGRSSRLKYGEIKEEHYKDFELTDVHFVTSIAFHSNENIVHIELDDKEAKIQTESN